MQTALNRARFALSATNPAILSSASSITSTRNHDDSAHGRVAATHGRDERTKQSPQPRAAVPNQVLLRIPFCGSTKPVDKAWRLDVGNYREPAFDPKPGRHKHSLQQCSSRSQEEQATDSPTLRTLSHPDNDYQASVRWKHWTNPEAAPREDKQTGPRVGHD